MDKSGQWLDIAGNQDIWKGFKVAHNSFLFSWDIEQGAIFQVWNCTALNGCVIFFLKSLSSVRFIVFKW